MAPTTHATEFHLIFPAFFFLDRLRPEDVLALPELAFVHESSELLFPLLRRDLERFGVELPFRFTLDDLPPPGRSLLLKTLPSDVAPVSSTSGLVLPTLLQLPLFFSGTKCNSLAPALFMISEFGRSSSSKVRPNDSPSLFQSCPRKCSPDLGPISRPQNDVSIFKTRERDKYERVGGGGGGGLERM